MPTKTRFRGELEVRGKKPENQTRILKGQTYPNPVDQKFQNPLEAEETVHCI